jgi:pantoate--beta-alanine ligase
MIVVERIGDVRGAVGHARHAGRRISLVPTMGSLHAGHLALVEHARREGAFVVMSIFVNPLQFGPGEDFTRYPRDAEGDSARARGVGTDLLFMPATADMYAAEMPVVVTPRIAGHVWEGKIRPGHFEGVLTVVAKLFNIVQPDVAVFGQKDVQQATLVDAMIRALDFPIELDIVPTVRDPDGLAMSSRNVYLSPSDRTQALALSRALGAVETAWREGNTDREELERTGRGVLAAAALVPDYFAIVEAHTLAPVATVGSGSIVIVAARVGPTRLIDNVVLGGVGSAEAHPVGQPRRARGDSPCR